MIKQTGHFGEMIDGCHSDPVKKGMGIWVQAVLKKAHICN